MPNGNKTRKRRPKATPKRTTKAMRPTQVWPQERKVNIPIAVGTQRNFKQPLFSTNGTTLTVTHREYFSDIRGSSNFQVFPFRINPARPGLVPWLAQMAPNWEMYRMKKLSFRYNTYQPTTAPGSVMFAFDPDVNDAPPASKTTALSYGNSMRTCTYLGGSLRVDGPSLNSNLWRYLQDAPRPGDDDRLNDLGNLFVCVEGQLNSKPIGEVEISYVIELRTPRTTDDAALSKAVTQTNGVASATPFGIVASQVEEGSYPAEVLLNEITFERAGRYLLDWQANDATGAGSQIPVVTATPGMNISAFTPQSMISDVNSGLFNLAQKFLVEVTDVVKDEAGSLLDKVGSVMGLEYIQPFNASTALTTITQLGKFDNYTAVLQPLRIDYSLPHKTKKGMFRCVPEPATPSPPPSWEVVETKQC